MGLGSSIKKAVKKITNSVKGTFKDILGKDLYDVVKTVVNPLALTAQLVGAVLPGSEENPMEALAPDTSGPTELQQTQQANYSAEQNRRKRTSPTNRGYATQGGVLGDTSIAIAKRMLG